MKKFSRTTALLLSAGMIVAASVPGYGYDASYTYDSASDGFADSYVYNETGAADTGYDTSYDVYNYTDYGTDTTVDYTYGYDTGYADDYTYTDSTVYDPVVYDETSVPDTSVPDTSASDDTVASFVTTTVEEFTAEDGEEESLTMLPADNGSALGYYSGVDVPFPDNWPAAPEITAASAYILDATTGTVLYSKNSSATVEISGPAKIMTALLVLERCGLNDQVKVTATGANEVYYDSSNINLLEGETLTVEDCVHGLLLASANDAALQLAEHTAGSVDQFIDLMNEKAAELGCTNTLFTNPTGLPDQDLSRGAQHTTARDLAVITKAAFDNPDFRRIASTVTYTIPENESQSARTFTSNFSPVVPNTLYYREGCIGGREGYTSDMALNIAGAVENNGQVFIVTALKGSDTTQDLINLFDYAASSFRIVEVDAPDTVSEGGIALLPSDSSVNDLEITTSQKMDGTHRQYYFGNMLVGYSVVPFVEDTSRPDPTPTPVIHHEENIQAANAMTAAKTDTPYYIIGAVTAILDLLLLVALVKVIISKKTA